jgi:tetratricopeptide (TPR) repeat protein
MKKSLYIRIALILFFLVLASPLPAQEVKLDKKQQKKVKQLVDEANNLVGQKRYQEALPKIEEAYNISRANYLLWNKARILEFIGDFENALYWFQMFSKLNDEKYQKQDMVLAKIEEMKAIVPPKLTVTGTPEKAWIFLDGKKIGESPLKDFMTTTGDHDLRIMLPSYYSKEYKVFLGRAEKKIMEYILEIQQGYVQFKGNEKDQITVKTEDGKSHLIDIPGNLTMSFGNHTIVIEKSNRYEPQTLEVSVSEEPVIVDLKPIPETIPSETMPIDVSVQKKEIPVVSEAYKTNAWKWVALGTGGAFVLGGVTFVVLGVLKNKSVQNAKTDEQGHIIGMTEAQAESRIKKANTYMVVSYVCLGIGVGTILTSLFLDSKIPVQKQVSLLPSDNGMIGTYSMEW